jgi:hypothetical protein
VFDQVTVSVVFPFTPAERLDAFAHSDEQITVELRFSQWHKQKLTGKSEPKLLKQKILKKV